MLDQLRRLDRFDLVHRLGKDVHGHVVAPRLVVGRAAVLLREGGDEGLRPWRVDEVMPDQWPRAEEIALSGAPGDGCIEAKSRNREIKAELRKLLQEVRDLDAGQVRYDETRLGIADLDPEGRTVRSI